MLVLIWSAIMTSMVRRKRQVTPHALVADACENAHNILVDYARDVADVSDARVKNHLRMTVVRGAYMCMALAHHADEDFIVDLPKDVALTGRFVEALAPIKDEHCEGEYMSDALAGATPSNDKRRRGAHMTPMSMVDKMVPTTIRPLLKVMRDHRSILKLRICDPACGAGICLIGVIRCLSKKLVAASGIGEICAKRLVAIHCCYGIDRDPVAVAAAKLALRIECRAFDLPIDWLDDNIKIGDALVGLDNDQIGAASWIRGDKPVTSIQKILENAMKDGVEQRRRRIMALSAMAVSRSCAAGQSTDLR